MPDDNVLGQQLIGALEKVNQLIPLAKTKKALKDIERTRARLLEEIGILVDTNVNQATKEYREATTKLKNATLEIEKAIQGMATIAKTIKTLARAVDIVAKVAAMA